MECEKGKIILRQEEYFSSKESGWGMRKKLEEKMVQ